MWDEPTWSEQYELVILSKIQARCRRSCQHVAADDETCSKNYMSAQRDRRECQCVSVVRSAAVSMIQLHSENAQNVLNVL